MGQWRDGNGGRSPLVPPPLSPPTAPLGGSRIVTTGHLQAALAMVGQPLDGNDNGCHRCRQIWQRQTSGPLADGRPRRMAMAGQPLAGNVSGWLAFQQWISRSPDLAAIDFGATGSSTSGPQQTAMVPNLHSFSPSILSTNSSVR
ncbi:Os04g0204900 [Oryza sativa Japonica Group]|uniref:Os04g0204900 protein n=1 Tax=Oryza sativa subsp. japonica TaxID=39947 RepID=A0A0P0W7K5_ORYSJ|nr:hypothetical protein DAI22_04g039600 [Oryza sativa Japonica Group]BAS88091.1 Os04g0204900 [Oryza sativa Japonica Group]